MSKFQTKKISEATPAELRTYASNFLGIDTSKDSDGAVLAKVTAANDGDTIWVMPIADVVDQSGSAPPAVAGIKENPGKLQGSLGRDDPKVTILIHNEERDGIVYSREKEVGVNGVVWLIQRGKPVDIPYRVYLALEAAERILITHDDEGVQHEQRAKAVPFNIVKMPTDAEIAAWHERTDALFVP